MDADFIPVIGAIIAAVIGAVGAIIAAIINHIKKEPVVLPKSSSSATWISNIPTIPNKSQFIGEQDLLQKLEKTLRKNQCERILISGIPGIGKKFYCHFLCKALSKSNINYIGFFSCKGSGNASQQIKAHLMPHPHRPLMRLRTVNDLTVYFQELHGSAVVFITDVLSQEQANELDFLMHFPNISVVITSSLRTMTISGVAFKPYILSPLNEIDSRKLFLYQNEYFENNRKINRILKYAHGIPLLIKAMSNTIRNTVDMDNFIKKLTSIGFKGLGDIEIEDEKNLRTKIADLLSSLYNVQTLSYDEKLTIGKLSVFGNLKFTAQFFEWFNISSRTVERLWLRHWFDKPLTDGDVFYVMSDVQQDIAEILGFQKSVEILMTDACGFFERENNLSYHFKNFSNYAEKIRYYCEVNGYTAKIAYQKFACNVVVGGYSVVLHDYEQAGIWLKSFEATDVELRANQTYLELRTFGNASDENIIIEYSDAAKCAAHELQFEKAIQMLHDIELQTITYLVGKMDSKELIDRIHLFMEQDNISSKDVVIMWDCMIVIYIRDLNVNTENLSDALAAVPLEVIESKYRYTMWLLFTMSKAYQILKYDALADDFRQKAVIVGNLTTGFCSEELKQYAEMTDGEFADYMHSSCELKENLKECLKKRMPEAFYIEGRYLEKSNDIKAAIKYYESGIEESSVRSSCALGYLYYKGKGVERDIRRAEALWQDGDERDHAGSSWRLYQLYHDSGDNSQADYYLRRAAKLGSKKAQSILDAKTAVHS